MLSQRLSVLSFILLAGCRVQAPPAGGGQDWPVYGGDPGGMKFSWLTQIDTANVQQLELAWTWATGEEPIPPPRQPIKGQDVRPASFQATPIAINDTLYLSTPYNQVVALEATTGRELWRYDPRAYEWGQVPNGTGFVHRGVATWTDGKERRIFLNSRWRLIALDAATGRPIESFGQRGEIDLTAELIWPVNRLHYTQTSPPVIYKNLVIVGNGVWDGFVYKQDPPGDVQAFDVRTGRRVWRFSPIPQESEYGTETWESESWRHTGHTNVWAPFTVDVERGLVYLPVGTPSNDYYGGHRLGDNLFAESLICLDANTGKRVWHFQTVRHGLWDYDLPAPPNLVTIRGADGRMIDAVAAPGKTGFLYVFNRVTGEPIWPFEDRPVPQSDIPGERTSPTQPVPTKPAPFAKQGVTEADLVDFTPALRAMALAEMAKYKAGPIFTPPSKQGTIMMPGVEGGANWGGAAFDPRTGWLFVRATNRSGVVAVEEPDLSVNRSGHQPPEADYALSRSAPRNVTVAGGIPLTKPPYGTLTAIDLNTGEHVWQIPLGDMPNVRFHPMLAGLDLPPLGGGGPPGPLATAGGLVFISGRNPHLYAVRMRDGAILWEGDLGGNLGTANPMTYQSRNGRQYVIIATGTANARLMAFALPTGGERSVDNTRASSAR